MDNSSWRDYSLVRKKSMRFFLRKTVKDNFELILKMLGKLTRFLLRDSPLDVFIL